MNIFVYFFVFCLFLNDEYFFSQFLNDEYFFSQFINDNSFNVGMQCIPNEEAVPSLNNIWIRFTIVCVIIVKPNSKIFRIILKFLNYL